jgi:hypothetical protein
MENGRWKMDDGRGKMDDVRGIAFGDKCRSIV